MSMLTIGAVARRSGVATSTIRYYEQIGLLPAPPRVNGQRRYTLTVLDTLALIREAQQSGFSLMEINTLVHGPSPAAPLSTRWHDLAQQKLVALEHDLRRIQAMQQRLERGMQCACQDLADCEMIGAARTCVHDPSTSTTLG